MHGFATLTAALAATTIFVGGLAYAADHALTVDNPAATSGMSQQQQATIGGAQEATHGQMKATAGLSDPSCRRLA